MPRDPYNLIYAPAVRRHLDAIDVKHHSLIREKIEEQLLFKPDIGTRNRKPLREPVPFSAEWEIRFGPDNRFRVLYDVLADEREVHILAIGVKEGNRLLVANEEIDL